MLPSLQGIRSRVVVSLLASCLLGSRTDGCSEFDGTGLPPPRPLFGISRTEHHCGVPRDKPVDQSTIDAFDSCCGGRAHWIPEFLVPSNFQGQLDQRDRDQAFCVPDEMIRNPDAPRKRCRSVFDLEGVCLSDCLPGVQAAEIPLPAANCPQGQRCTPCVDPKTDAPTGACDSETSCSAAATTAAFNRCLDFAPTLRGSQYPRCCQNGRAHCAPADLVLNRDADGHVSPLAAERAKDLFTCDDGAGFCVPDPFLARGGRYTPPRCRSIGGREGRCMSICTKTVAADQDVLPQASCADDERCAPCYSPRTGLPTGACNKGPCDAPSETPQRFQPCGETVSDAFCIPKARVPSNHRDSFTREGCQVTCQDPDTRCVPKKIIDAGTSFVAKTCRSPLAGLLGGVLSLKRDPRNFLRSVERFAQGVCLSPCMPEVAERVSELEKNDCDLHEVCVPCLDPKQAAEGELPTGACAN